MGLLKQASSLHDIHLWIPPRLDLAVRDKLGSTARVMASAALAPRQARGCFRRAPHSVRLGTTPQRLLLQG